MRFLVGDSSLLGLLRFMRKCRPNSKQFSVAWVVAGHSSHGLEDKNGFLERIHLDYLPNQVRKTRMGRFACRVLFYHSAIQLMEVGLCNQDSK